MKNLSIQTLFIGVLAIMLVCGAATAHAATFTVTKATNSNDGVCNADCSLREAVAAANDGDTVVFNSNLIGSTLTLGGTAIDIFKHITIDGTIDSVNVAFVSGSGTSRHFNVQSGASLDLKNITLVSGSGGNEGGSINTNDASLSLDRVSIRGNTSNFVGALHLFGTGVYKITNSSITSNTAPWTPAILVTSSGSLYMSNTTVTNNKNTVDEPSGWGALTSFSNNTVVLRNCTIAYNQAKRGGGLYTGGGGTFSVGNTIVAHNTATFSGQDIFAGPPLVSAGGNLIENPDTVPGAVFTNTNDVEGFNPLLAPTNALQGGHPVDTHPLNAGSLAINTGLNSLAVEPLGGTLLAQDARGPAFPRIAGGTVDKGAFEDQSNSSTVVVSKLADSNDGFCDKDCSLREAVQTAFNDSGTDTITMAANVFGTMPVGGAEIAIVNQNVNIVGYPSISSDALIVSGSATSRVFRLDNSNVTMTGFTIANGTGNGQSEPFGGGGILASGGSLTLNQMILRNNTTAEDGSGGALTMATGNVLRIMNSTINGNSGSQISAVSSSASINYVTNTTITANTNSGGFAGLGAMSIASTLYMRNSTIANNRGNGTSTGAGLYCAGASTCNLGNNILADNIAGSNPDLFVVPGGTLQSVGGNLVESTTGFNNGSFNQPNDQLGADPMLMVLGDNGGSVTTIALAPNSPAINTGRNTNAVDPFSSQPLGTDARGAGFTRILGGVVDKGAFETAGPTAAKVTVSGKVMTPDGRGLRNAVVVMADQNGGKRTVTTSALGNYRFDDVEVGQTYIVSVNSKLYRFAPRVTVLLDELTDLNFTGME